jgi:hypothetical protein
MVEEWHCKFIPKISDSNLSKSNADLYVTSEDFTFTVSEVNKIFSSFGCVKWLKLPMSQGPSLSPSLGSDMIEDPNSPIYVPTCGP